MVLNSQPFFQVGDVMQHTRVVALIDEGRLLADRDPWDMSDVALELIQDDAQNLARFS